jgi:hypothetical protein
VGDSERQVPEKDILPVLDYFESFRESLVATFGRDDCPVEALVKYFSYNEQTWRRETLRTWTRVQSGRFKLCTVSVPETPFMAAWLVWEELILRGGVDPGELTNYLRCNA